MYSCMAYIALLFWGVLAYLVSGPFLPSKSQHRRCPRSAPISFATRLGERICNGNAQKSHNPTSPWKARHHLQQTCVHILHQELCEKSCLPVRVCDINTGAVDCKRVNK